MGLGLNRGFFYVESKTAEKKLHFLIYQADISFAFQLQSKRRASVGARPDTVIRSSDLVPFLV